MCPLFYSIFLDITWNINIAEYFRDLLNKLPILHENANISDVITSHFHFYHRIALIRDRRMGFGLLLWKMQNSFEILQEVVLLWRPWNLTAACFYSSRLQCRQRSSSKPLHAVFAATLRAFLGSSEVLITVQTQQFFWGIFLLGRNVRFEKRRHAKLYFWLFFVNG